MDRHIEYLSLVFDQPPPDKTMSCPPRHYYSQAVDFFRAVRDGTAEKPADYADDVDDAKINEMIKSNMIKWLMYEKMMTDLIVQGFEPKIDESLQFVP